MNVRKEIFKLCFGDPLPNFVDVDALAEATDGYSGDDIKTLVKKAKDKPIQKIATATHFKRVEFWEKTHHFWFEIHVIWR